MDWPSGLDLSMHARTMIQGGHMRAMAAVGACLLLASSVTGTGLVNSVGLRAPLCADLGRGSALQRVVVAKADEGSSSGGSVEKSVFIKATPEECFRVATAYEDYPKWAKATAGVSVLSRTGELGKQVEMRMGMFGIEVKSTFEYSYSRPTQMEWKSVAGNIKVRSSARQRAMPRAVVRRFVRARSVALTAAASQRGLRAAGASRALYVLAGGRGDQGGLQAQGGARIPAPRNDQTGHNPGDLLDRSSPSGLRLWPSGLYACTTADTPCAAGTDVRD